MSQREVDDTMVSMSFWESFPRVDQLPETFKLEYDTNKKRFVSPSDHISRRGDALLNEVKTQWKGITPALRTVKKIHEKVPLVAVPPSIISLLHEQWFTYLHPARSGFNPFHSAYHATVSPFRDEEEFLWRGVYHVDAWFAPSHLWEAAKPAHLGDYDRLKKVPFLHGVPRDGLRLWWDFPQTSTFELLHGNNTEFSSLVSRPGLNPSYELPFGNAEEYTQFCGQPAEEVFRQIDDHMAFAAVNAFGTAPRKPKGRKGQLDSSDQRFDYLTLYELKNSNKGVIFPLQSIIKNLALREFGDGTRVSSIPLVQNKSVEEQLQDQLGLRWWWCRKVSFGGDGTAVGIHVVCSKSSTAGEEMSVVADRFAETVREDGNPWGWNPDTLFEGCWAKETSHAVELFLI